MSEVDVHDGAALRRFHAVWQRVERDWAPLGIPTPYEHLAAQLRHQPAYVGTRSWLGDDGAATAWWHETLDNRHRLDLTVGGDEATAGELVDAAAALACDLGRTHLGLETVAGSVADAWAAANGFKLGLSEEQNVCRTADLDRDALLRWRDQGDPVYELVTFTGDVPGDLLEDFVALRAAMNDAPRGELVIEDVVYTREREVEHRRAHAAAGFETWTALARETATGRLVGLTELVVSPHWPEVIEQDDTTVHPAHRGHRLGLRVKAANLLRVLEERPGCVCVWTWNAESNKPMIDVNRALGFRRQCVWNEWETTV